LLIDTLKFFRGYKRLAGIITARWSSKVVSCFTFPENERRFLMFRKSVGISVTPSKSWKANSVRNLSIPAIAILFSASSALAAAPAVVIDAQQTIGSNYSNPQSVAVAPNGTVYVADTNNNRVVALTTNLPGTSTQSTVKTGTLTSPQALAVDAKGDLYIADRPSPGHIGRVIEVVANSSGVLTSQVSQIYYGSLLTAPTSLAVDSSNTLFIGESETCGTGAIYSLPAGGTTPHQVNITGLPSAFIPSALVRDASSNLYFCQQRVHQWRRLCSAYGRRSRPAHSYRVLCH
jgi:NHL repeat-containing protein